MLQHLNKAVCGLTFWIRIQRSSNIWDSFNGSKKIWCNNWLKNMYLSKNRMVRVKVQHSISASTKLILSSWISWLRNEVYGLLFQNVWIWSWFSIYRFYNSGSISWLLCCIFIICKIEINNNNIKHRFIVNITSHLVNSYI